MLEASLCCGCSGGGEPEAFADGGRTWFNEIRHRRKSWGVSHRGAEGRGGPGPLLRSRLMEPLGAPVGAGTAPPRDAQPPPKPRGLPSPEAFEVSLDSHTLHKKQAASLRANISFHPSRARRTRSGLPAAVGRTAGTGRAARPRPGLTRSDRHRASRAPSLAHPADRLRCCQRPGGLPASLSIYMGGHGGGAELFPLHITRRCGRVSTRGSE